MLGFLVEGHICIKTNVVKFGSSEIMYVELRAKKLWKVYICTARTQPCRLSAKLKIMIICIKTKMVNKLGSSEIMYVELRIKSCEKCIHEKVSSLMYVQKHLIYVIRKWNLKLWLLASKQTWWTSLIVQICGIEDLKLWKCTLPNIMYVQNTSSMSPANVP